MKTKKLLIPSLLLSVVIASGQQVPPPAAPETPEPGPPDSPVAAEPAVAADFAEASRTESPAADCSRNRPRIRSE